MVGRRDHDVQRPRRRRRHGGAEGQPFALLAAWTVLLERDDGRAAQPLAVQAISGVCRNDRSGRELLAGPGRATEGEQSWTTKSSSYSPSGWSSCNRASTAWKPSA